MKNFTFNNQISSGQLALARALELPSREAMLRRDLTVTRFWADNKQLLSDAWQEWEENEHAQLSLDDRLLDAQLRHAVEQAWLNPSKEIAVEKLWQEVSPGVYQCQFFDQSRIGELRDYLESVQNANIPLRPPYGIALNRFGAMLDERSDGYLAAPTLQSLYHQILDKYMRPISRLLFPEVIGYDTQTFGFSIQYQPGLDTSLQPHSDASAATLNINLNLPDESYTGSEVDFYDPISGKVNRLSFQPGMAMLHRGSVAHAAQPITSGKRTNFVLWLYGDRMQLPINRPTNRPINRFTNESMDKTAANPALSPQQRWSQPTAAKDEFAPF